MLITNLTVLVVDAEALECVAIGQALSYEAQIGRVITAQDYAEAEKQATRESPDIIWLEMNSGHAEGIAEIRRLKQLSPASHVMVIVDEEDEQEALAAILAGAQGYHSKQDVDPNEIVSMIQRLYRDEFVLSLELLKRCMERLRSMALAEAGSASSSGTLQFRVQLKDLAQLTTQEREIAQFIRQGYGDGTIAERLHISEQAVHKHVERILDKLGM